MAILQFVSSAETDSAYRAYSAQYPCFGPNWFIHFCHTWRWIWLNMYNSHLRFFVVGQAMLCRESFVEEWWWPEFDMFGSMPWCSLPWHKLLPGLTQKNCFIVYRLKLIHEFASFFSTKVIFAGMAKKTFLCKQAFVDRKQGPRFSQGQPKWAEPIARMAVVWKVEKAEHTEFNVPTCGNFAVCQQRRDRQRL